MDCSSCQIQFSGFEKTVENVANKIDKHIENSGKHYEELLSLRVEDSKLLSSVSTTVQDIQRRLNSAEKVCPNPEIIKTVVSNTSIIKIHSWLLKTIVGAIVVLSFTSILTAASSCPGSDSNDEVVTSSERTSLE